ncbi:MAG TPA: hypothetical protein VGE97_04655 [Nitrososphaera sp.]|jgi:hypothetical protein
MYDIFRYEEVDGSSVKADFLMTITTAGYICLTDCHFELTGSSTDRPRMEANASWPTFTYYKGLLCYIECDILADTPQHFASFWNSMLQSIMIAPDIIQTDRLQGRLCIKPAGFSENLLLPVVISDAPTIPRGGVSPSYGKMTMTFKAFRPYFVGATTDDPYWHV